MNKSELIVAEYFLNTMNWCENETCVWKRSKETHRFWSFYEKKKNYFHRLLPLFHTERSLGTSVHLPVSVHSVFGNFNARNQIDSWWSLTWDKRVLRWCCQELSGAFLTIHCCICLTRYLCSQMKVSGAAAKTGPTAKSSSNRSIYPVPSAGWQLHGRDPQGREVGPFRGRSVQSKEGMARSLEVDGPTVAERPERCRPMVCWFKCHVYIHIIYISIDLSFLFKERYHIYVLVPLFSRRPTRQKVCSCKSFVVCLDYLWHCLHTHLHWILGGRHCHSWSFTSFHKHGNFSGTKRVPVWHGKWICFSDMDGGTCFLNFAVLFLTKQSRKQKRKQRRQWKRLGEKHTPEQRIRIEAEEVEPGPGDVSTSCMHGWECGSLKFCLHGGSLCDATTARIIAFITRFYPILILSNFPQHRTWAPKFNDLSPCTCTNISCKRNWDVEKKLNAPPKKGKKWPYQLLSSAFFFVNYGTWYFMPFWIFFRCSQKRKRWCLNIATKHYCFVLDIQRPITAQSLWTDGKVWSKWPWCVHRQKRWKDFQNDELKVCNHWWRCVGLVSENQELQCLHCAPASASCECRIWLPEKFCFRGCVFWCVSADLHFFSAVMWNESPCPSTAQANQPRLVHMLMLQRIYSEVMQASLWNRTELKTTRLQQST